ncbi:MAG: hypothetical protein ABSD99_06730 [Candidatus Bathyarchaeia archaeon]
MKEDGCAHDYDESWVCRICGYQLPNTVQNKIKQVGKGATK